MVGINKVEINEEHEGKFKDGIISPLTEKSYVVFCRNKGPDVIMDNIKGYYIPRYNTGENSVPEIVKGVREAIKRMPTLAIIIYHNPNEKKKIIEGLEKEENAKNRDLIGLIRRAKNRISEWFNDKLKKADLEGARREA